MHSLLKRQIRKFFPDEDAIPENLQPFVSAVNAAYEQSDIDRAMLERSLEISSEEMRESYKKLQSLHIELERRIQERTSELSRTNASLQAEIVERKQVEVMQDAVYRIAQAAEDIESLNHFYPEIHRIISNVMPAENFYIALYDSENDELSFAYYVDEVDAAPPGKIRLGRGMSAYVLRTGKSQLCDEARYVELERQGEVELLGPPSPIWLGVPLNIHNRPIGVMAVQHYSNPTAYGEAEKHILEFVSSQVARAIERKRIEEEMRARETRYAALIKNSVDNISLLSTDGSLLYENSTTIRPLGYPEGSFLGLSLFELVHPDDIGQAQQAMADVLARPSTSRNWELRLRHIDGSWRWMEGTATNLLEEPSIHAVVLNYRDVTERNQTRAALDQQNRILSALHETTLALMGHLDLNNVLQTIVRQAAHLVDTPHGYLYLVTPGQDELVVEIATGMYESRKGFRLKRGNGLAGKVLETGQPIVVDDYYAWDQRAAALDDTPIHAIVGVPLTSETRTVGVIGLSYEESGRTFNAEDVELLTRFARLASIALENANLHNLVQKELTARNEAEANLRRLTDNMLDVITQINAEGSILYASPSHKWVLGLEANDMLGHLIFERLHPDDVADALTVFSQAVMDGRTPGAVTFRYRHADDHYIWMECVGNILTDSDGQFAGAVLSSRDITVRKNIEAALREREHLYRLLAENASDVIWVRDMNLRATYTSPAVEKLRGFTVEEALAQSPDQIITPTSLQHALEFLSGMRTLADTIPLDKLKTEYRTLELEMYKKDGSTLWTETQVSFLLDEEGNPNGILGVTRDISERRKSAEKLRSLNAELEERVKERTVALSQANESLVNEVNERKAAEKQVRASLQEKEVLLKEIHHRVKNNLQIISSLLNLQASQITDTVTLQALRDSQARVRSMALIHERLYQSQSLEKINFGDYIKSLTHDLFRSYLHDLGQVQLHFELDDAQLDLDQAVSSGLILNELMTNALKYAFPGKREGMLSVKLKVHPGQLLSLRVADNGVGVPPHFDITNTKSLGLQLVKRLVDQLDGKLEMDCSNGTAFEITFKYS